VIGKLSQISKSPLASHLHAISMARIQVEENKGHILDIKI